MRCRNEGSLQSHVRKEPTDRTDTRPFENGRPPLRERDVRWFDAGCGQYLRVSSFGSAWVDLLSGFPSESVYGGNTPGIPGTLNSSCKVQREKIFIQMRIVLREERTSEFVHVLHSPETPTQNCIVKSFTRRCSSKSCRTDTRTFENGHPPETVRAVG